MVDAAGDGAADFIAQMEKISAMARAHLVALVRNGATFRKGQLVERVDVAA